VAGALLIFKPDSAYRLAVRRALGHWLREERGWRIEALAWYQAPRELIESHYDFLQGRPFFSWLVDFMTALPLPVGRISADSATLESMRYELGETQIAQARPGSLRERYGILAGVNCMHLSDSPATGERELALWTRYLPLDSGQADLDAPSDRPDHTFHLRSLAGQISGGQHAELAAQEIKRLLKEETELEGSDFEALCRVILGAFA
jgi:nucleoside-diphosphate kinase